MNDTPTFSLHTIDTINSFILTTKYVLVTSEMQISHKLSYSLNSNIVIIK